MLTPCNINKKSSATLLVSQPSFFNCFLGTVVTVCQYNTIHITFLGTGE